MKKLKNNWITKTISNRLYELPVPVIGLTGGIATGKSTVAQYFREEGIPVIDADQLVKDIYKKKESMEFLLKSFPDAVHENVINFKKLREIAFRNADNQKKLETFIYAQLPDVFKKTYEEQPPHEFIVYDVPLLFEKHLNDKVDLSICVYADRKTQLERLIKRDLINSELAENILSKQMDIEEKKKNADIVIQNVDDITTLKKNFEDLMIKLLK
jgi:dephospho-CoA kinase